MPPGLPPGRCLGHQVARPLHVSTGDPHCSIAFLDLRVATRLPRPLRRFRGCTGRLRSFLRMGQRRSPSFRHWDATVIMFYSSTLTRSTANTLSYAAGRPGSGGRYPHGRSGGAGKYSAHRPALRRRPDRVALGQSLHAEKGRTPSTWPRRVSGQFTSRLPRHCFEIWRDV